FLILKPDKYREISTIFQCIMATDCIQQKSFDQFRRKLKLLFFQKMVYTTYINILWKRGINMRDKDCIFCKIAAGEIPSATLYEDDDFRVILDLGPASKGHALILPKEHFRNLYDIDDELAAKAMVLAKKMVKKLTDVLGCDGYNIVQNNEECAGQTVFHFHMHLI